MAYMLITKNDSIGIKDQQTGQFICNLTPDLCNFTQSVSFNGSIPESSAFSKLAYTLHLTGACNTDLTGMLLRMEIAGIVKVTMSINHVQVASTASATLTSSNAIPVNCRPLSAAVRTPIIVMNEGAYTTGLLEIGSDGVIRVLVIKNNIVANFTNPGEIGYMKQTITYFTD